MLFRSVGLELLATPALQTLEVYALAEASGEPAQDCPLLPAAVMGDLSEPIRMVYYADVSGAAMEATDQFAYPGGAAIPLAAEQPLLLRYSIQTGAEPEDLEVFLNLTSVASAAVVAQPFTFSYESINIPAMQNAEIVTTCPFLYAHDVLTVAGHQHGSIFQGQAVGAGTEITVEYDGAELLSGRAGPWAVLGPLSVARDTGLTFTCAFDNRGSEPIGHGSTEFDEKIGRASCRERV